MPLGLSISWGNVGFGLFLLYIVNSFSIFYNLFFPTLCHDSSQSCFRAKFTDEKQYDFYMFGSSDGNNIQGKNLLANKNGISITDGFEEMVEVKLQDHFIRNTTLYGILIVVPTGVNPLARSGGPVGQYITLLTSFKKPDFIKTNLMDSVSFSDNSTAVTAHWRPKLIAHILDPELKFDGKDYPKEFGRLMNHKTMTYNPVLYVDQLSITRRHDVPLKSSVNLTISFSPISIGKLRIWMQFEEAVRSLKDLGFGEDDVDEIKGIFADTNMYFLTLTFFVAIFHLLFDFLAFKNDISFWKKRKNMAGLSTRVIIWRCVSQVIIFLYLCEHKTSYIVLGPAGVGMFIELWKVTKSLKCTMVGWKVQLGEKTEEEKATEKIDSEAMWYLQWLMYPLIVGGAVYSLLYMSHRSWLVQLM